MKIKLEFPPKITSLRLIVFYSIDPSGPKEPSCGGLEENISLPEGSLYKDCEASSQFPTGEFDCNFAFSGKMEDSPFGMWASNGEGIAAWV